MPPQCTQNQAEAQRLFANQIQRYTEKKRTGFLRPEFVLRQDKVGDVLNVIDPLVAVLADKLERVITMGPALRVSGIPKIDFLAMLSPKSAGFFKVLALDV